MLTLGEAALLRSPRRAGRHRYSKVKLPETHVVRCFEGEASSEQQMPTDQRSHFGRVRLLQLRQC